MPYRPTQRARDHRLTMAIRGAGTSRQNTKGACSQVGRPQVIRNLSTRSARVSLDGKLMDGALPGNHAFGRGRALRHTTTAAAPNAQPHRLHLLSTLAGHREQALAHGFGHVRERPFPGICG
jgi:hypothetical protein